MTKLWIVLLLASTSFASDIFSIGIRTSFRYESLEKQCYLPPLANNFVLAAELEGETIVQAKLKKTLMDGYSKILELTPQEISGIKTETIDSRLWLKTWGVSGRVLEMLLFGGTDQGIDTCYPSKGINEIHPDSFVFDFKTHGSGKSYSDSNEAHFTGTSKDSEPFRIDLFLVQDRI